jgi:hypothetical protein
MTNWPVLGQVMEHVLFNGHRTGWEQQILQN